MKTLRYKIIILLCFIFFANIKTYSQVEYTTNYRWEVFHLLSSIETGSPLVDPGGIIPYYSLHGYSSAEALEKSKMEKLGLTALEVSPVVDYTENIDSVLTNRAKVHALDELDKSNMAGGFAGLEGGQLDKALSLLNKDMLKLFSLSWNVPYSSRLRETYNFKFMSLLNGAAIARGERMTTVNRKKIYTKLYNDVVRYDNEIRILIGYFLSTMDLEQLKKTATLKRIDKSDYISYGRSRWVTACRASMSKKVNK